MWLSIASFIIWIACPSFLTGCGTENIIQRESSPELLKHVDEFKEEAKKRGTDQDIESNLLFINYVKFEDPQVWGRCEVYDMGLGYAVKLAKVTKTFSKEYRRAIVYHEIAHCEYEVRHAKDEELSLMTSAMQEEWIIQSKWDELMIDLFKRIK